MSSGRFTGRQVFMATSVYGDKCLWRQAFTGDKRLQATSVYRRQELIAAGESDDLLDAAGPDAPRAHVAALDFAVLFEPDLLQVRQPTMTGQVVSVAHSVPVLGAFVADRALPAHGAFLLGVEFTGAAI